jgi:hypothetical protein
MAKSAQEKFNEFLDECRETSQAVSAMVSESYENYNNYAYACGVLESMLKDAIAELPKARRAEFRAQLFNLAQKQRNERLSSNAKEVE